MASFKVDVEAGDASEAGFEAPEGLEVAAVFDDFESANEAGLAILAMGNVYWTLLHEECYFICVKAARVRAVRQELREFAALRKVRRQQTMTYPREFRFGRASFVIYALVLIGFFTAQHYAPLQEIGRSDAVAIVGGGEWWRLLTALNLHADVVHLVSNIVSGMGFAFFVCRFFGAASGWALILLSGILGNLLNALVYYPEPHLSIGASTAVFGALGLLTGIGGWAAISQPGQKLMIPRWLLPIFGGLTLLGLFGLGEGNVDVAAHISGFLCGTALGAVAAFFNRIFIPLAKRQGLVAVSTLLCIAIAWAWGFFAT